MVVWTFNRRHRRFHHRHRHHHHAPDHRWKVGVMDDHHNHLQKQKQQQQQQQRTKCPLSFRLVITLLVVGFQVLVLASIVSPSSSSSSSKSIPIDKNHTKKDAATTTMTTMTTRNSRMMGTNQNHPFQEHNISPDILQTNVRNPSSSLSTTPKSLPNILVVGLPKSGTTSIYHLFTCSLSLLGTTTPITTTTTTTTTTTLHYCCCGSNHTEYPCTGGKQISQQIQDNRKFNRGILDDIDVTTTTTTTTTSTTNNQHDKNRRRQQQQQQRRRRILTQIDGEIWETDGYILPQYDSLPLLHSADPDAIWILPLRPAQDWAKSVLHWLDLAQRLYNTFGPGTKNTTQNQHYHSHHSHHTKSHQLERVVVGSSSSSSTTTTTTATVKDTTIDTTPIPSKQPLEQFLIDFYHNHTQRIRDFVQQPRQGHTLIEVNITNPNAGQIIAQVIPDVNATWCWKRHNAGPFFSSTSNHGKNYN